MNCLWQQNALFVVTFSMPTNDGRRTRRQWTIYKCGHAVSFLRSIESLHGTVIQSVNSIDASPLLIRRICGNKLCKFASKCSARHATAIHFSIFLVFDLRCEEFGAFHENCTIPFSRVSRSTASTKSFAKSLIYTNCGIWCRRHFSELAPLHLPFVFFVEISWISKSNVDASHCERVQESLCTRRRAKRTIRQSFILSVAIRVHFIRSLWLSVLHQFVCLHASRMQFANWATANQQSAQS